MAIDKYLVVIGLSDEDTAHLRLLMRAAADQLSHRWRWGTEDNADLVVVDPEVFAGQMARNRSFSGGRRCAVLSETEPLRNGESRMHKPLSLENIIEVLNASSATNSSMASQIVEQKGSFYELESLAPGTESMDDTDLASSPQRELTPADGLEEFLKPDAASYKPAFTVPLELHQDTTLEARHRPSARSERRVADSASGLRKIDPGSELNLADPFGADPTGTAPSSLRSYLEGNLLGGPSIFALEGAPPLMLDPKTKTFHSPAANLPALAPYCTRPLPQREWRQVTSVELNRVREDQPAQQYDRLVWLSVLLRSAGRLATHLDPGGRYRLKVTARIERDVARHANIASAMHEFAKLNEISAQSGASMAEVFAIVNAYDAIGALELEPRRPRHTPTQGTKSLFSKLNPFKKS